MSSDKGEREERNIYDVNTYTDAELLEILDLSNPTDRELEAKIIHLIRKYELIDSPSAGLLSNFYRDIYFHFFDLNPSLKFYVNLYHAAFTKIVI